MFMVMITRNLTILPFACTFKSWGCSWHMRSSTWCSAGAKARASRIQVGSTMRPEGGSRTRGRRWCSIRNLRKPNQTQLVDGLWNKKSETNQIQCSGVSNHATRKQQYQQCLLQQFCKPQFLKVCYRQHSKYRLFVSLIHLYRYNGNDTHKYCSTKLLKYRKQFQCKHRIV